MANKNLDGGILLKRGKEILDILYSETLELINKNKEGLNNLAVNLIEKEVLHEDEINKILLTA